MKANRQIQKNKENKMDNQKEDREILINFLEQFSITAQAIATDIKYGHGFCPNSQEKLYELIIETKDAIEDLINKGKDLEKIVLSRAVQKHIERKILAYKNKTVIFS